jgi:hypothetical protein
LHLKAEESNFSASSLAKIKAFADGLRKTAEVNIQFRTAIQAFRKKWEERGIADPYSIETLEAIG